MNKVSDSTDDRIEEHETLLMGDKGVSFEADSMRRKRGSSAFIWSAVSVAVLASAAVALVTSFINVPVSAHVARKNLSFNSSVGWRMQKYTLNVNSGTGQAVQRFVSQYLCEPKTRCPSDLGCGSLRSWCTITTPFSSNEWPGTQLAELHWVDSSTLQDTVAPDGTTLSNDDWVNYFEVLNGPELAPFNAFMHNKAVLYTGDLASFEQRFADGNITALMRRQSIDPSGIAVGHVGFALAGRVYELVGPAASFLGGGSGVPFWSDVDGDNECASSHALGSSLATYAAAAASQDEWEGSAPVMLVQLSLAYSDPQVVQFFMIKGNPSTCLLLTCIIC